MKKKKLGCCGYDDLGYKPPTTTPYDPTKAIRVENRISDSRFTSQTNIFQIKNRR